MYNSWRRVGLGGCTLYAVFYIRGYTLCFEYVYTIHYTLYIIHYVSSMMMFDIYSTDDTLKSLRKRSFNFNFSFSFTQKSHMFNDTLALTLALALALLKKVRLNGKRKSIF